MSKNYEFILGVTLDSDALEVQMGPPTPSTDVFGPFDDLLIQYSMRTTGFISDPDIYDIGYTGGTYAYAKLNQDSTPGNYSWTGMRSTGIWQSTFDENTFQSWYDSLYLLHPADNHLSPTSFGVGAIRIYDYASPGPKVITSEWHAENEKDLGRAALLGHQTGLWNGDGNGVWNISFGAMLTDYNEFNIVAGSTFSLYGIYR